MIVKKSEGGNTMDFREYSSPEEVADGSLSEFFKLMAGLCNEVYSALGEGFTEEMYQRALQIEMRKAGVRFQREVHIEIFYKGVPLGFDRPDFIVRPFTAGGLRLSVPVIIELKTTKKLSEKNKTQAKTYLRSIPHSSDGELKDCKHCLLINFPDMESEGVEAVLIERL
jgi:GxxExxY protein